MPGDPFAGEFVRTKLSALRPAAGYSQQGIVEAAGSATVLLGSGSERPGGEGQRQLLLIEKAEAVGLFGLDVTVLARKKVRGQIQKTEICAS
jgi:hypothetical protein